MQKYTSEQYVESQREEWTSVASAWEKWDKELDNSMLSMNEDLVELAGIASGQTVLDLGSGTGYPAVSAARKVGETGNVTGLDLSESMLTVASEKCRSMNLMNVTFQSCDIAAIPFDDSTFDAVTSRFCLMFLPHLSQTLNEVKRVLKPGGGFSVAVWASKEKNPSLSIPFRILREFVDIPKPEPSQPGIFALSKPGHLSGLMVEAGFNNVFEKEYPVEWTYASGREYMECLKEMAAPLKKFFDRLTPEKCREVEDKIAEAAEEFGKNGRICIPGETLVLSARKLKIKN